MKKEPNTTDNRGLSYTIDYAVTITILIVVFAVLTSSLSGGLSQTERNAAQYESERIASEVVGNIDHMDTQIQNIGSNEKVSNYNMQTRVPLPPQIAGGNYAITLRNDGSDQYLRINHVRFVQPYELPLNTETDVVLTNTVTGSGLVMTYNEGENQIEIGV